MTNTVATREIQQLIGGVWRSGTGADVIDVVNPATEAPVATIQAVSKEDLGEAAESATAGFDVWRAVPAIERAAVLRKTAAAMRENTEAIARVLTEENGKTLAESRGEVTWAAEYFDWYADEARRLYGRTIPSRVGRSQLQVVEPEPIGPVLALAPWNWPLVTVARKVAPALAAGCSVIVKPAEEAPSAAVAVARILLESGLPSDVIQLVVGHPAEVSDFLISHPAIKKISFTGSVAVGRQLAAHAGEHLKRITLELGGHAPVIVLDDVDVASVVDKIVPIKFRTSGQVCSCPSRFYVHSSIAESFEKAIADKARALAVGDGSLEDSAMGPLISERRVSAVEGLVSDALDQGARLVSGGERIDGAGYFFQPTVLADVPDTARIMVEEPFAPVVPISTFDSVDDVISRANSVSVGLAAYVFTDKLSTARELATRLAAGNVGVNTLGVSIAEAPFGGVGDSGDGREGGIEGIQSYLTTKLIVEAC